VNEINASYFDLAAQPNESIRSKTTGNFLRLPKPPRNLQVPDNWQVKMGDVLSWSEGRPSETYLSVEYRTRTCRTDARRSSRRSSVTAERTLLKNPDTSGSGYLTVPLVITCHLSDAVAFFSRVLDDIGRSYVASIELAPVDAFFPTHFCQQVLPTSITRRTDVSYSFDPNDDVLHVTLTSDVRRSRPFPLETTQFDELIQWISMDKESHGSWTVTFKFEGHRVCSTVPRGAIKRLPTGWRCEQQGVVTISDDRVQGQWRCHGPEKSKETARKAIERHYKDLHVEIQ
jgi:hypothetical protein